MLGNSLLSVRLGGIYALQSLDREASDLYHAQVIHLLSAFVRHPPQYVTGDDSTITDWGGSLSADRQDIGAAIEIINSRDKRQIELERRSGLSGLDPSSKHLQGARFTKTDLSCALIHHSDATRAVFKETNMHGCRLKRVRAYLKISRAKPAA